MTRRFMHAAIFVAAIFLRLACGGLEAQTAPAAKSFDAKSTAAAGNAESGEKLFAGTGCTACHGAQGQGTSLAPQIAPPPLELPAMISYVRQPTGKMPPVPNSTASDKDLADVYSFLQSIPPSAASSETSHGDAANGKKLFAAYGCYECHDRQGQGASTAPRIGPPRISLVAVLRYVRQPTGQMPPYTAKFVSDQDLADIYAYLSSFPPPAPAANIPLLNQ
jgi:mono/diheme cytochrome c family protein